MTKAKFRDNFEIIQNLVGWNSKGIPQKFIEEINPWIEANVYVVYQLLLVTKTNKKYIPEEMVIAIYGGINLLEYFDLVNIYSIVEKKLNRI